MEDMSTQSCRSYLSHKHEIFVQQNGNFKVSHKPVSPFHVIIFSRVGLLYDCLLNFKRTLSMISTLCLNFTSGDVRSSLLKTVFYECESR